MYKKVVPELEYGTYSRCTYQNPANIFHFCFCVTRIDGAMKPGVSAHTSSVPVLAEMVHVFVVSNLHHHNFHRNISILLAKRLQLTLARHIQNASRTLAGVAQWIERGLQTTGLPVRFPVRAHAWIAGQVPSGGHMRGNHTSIFLSLFPPFPSL